MEGAKSVWIGVLRNSGLFLGVWFLGFGWIDGLFGKNKGDGFGRTRYLGFCARESVSLNEVLS